MGYTYQLANYPLVDQLTDPATNGSKNQNATENCVSASLSSAVLYFTGRRVSSDTLTDTEYGGAYTGGEAASSYIKLMASYGVTLTHQDGSQAYLISVLRAQIKAGHPCLVTVPSSFGGGNYNAPVPANPLAPGASHVMVCYAIDGTDGGWAECMNPWHGVRYRMPISALRSHLCYGQVWPMAKAGTSTSGAGTSAAVPDDGYSKLGGLFRAYVDAHAELRGACVSGGERVMYRYAGGAYESMAAFKPTASRPYGTILHYDSRSGQMSDTLGAWVVTGQVDAVDALAKERDALTAEVASLNAAHNTTTGDAAALQKDRDALASKLAQVRAIVDAA